MKLFASGATTPLVVKIRTKQPWVKIENLRNFHHNFALFIGKIDYSYFIIFLRYGSKTLHKNFQVISSKNEGVTTIFPNFDLILNLKNQGHAFIFTRNDFKFFV